MNIQLRCTGGFTGPAGVQTRNIDLAALPLEQAQHLESLLQSCDFFALPDRLNKSAPQSWDFRYALQVDHGGLTHTVTYYLDAAPPPLQALTAALLQGQR